MSSSNRRKQTSALIGILITLGVGFLLCWIPQTGDWMIKNLAFQGDIAKIWQLVTFPFVTPGFGLISFLFGMLWLYFFCRFIEQDLGDRGFLIAFAAGSALLGLTAWLATIATGTPKMLYGTFSLSAFLTIIACARRPAEEICLWAVIRLKFFWIGLIMVAALVIENGVQNPVAGLIFLLPAALAWAYGDNRIPFLRYGKALATPANQKKAENRQFDQFYGKVRDRAKEREERERLRKLFEGSIKDGQEPPADER
jgi:membrane associated rhomboid family serine protease